MRWVTRFTLRRSTLMVGDCRAVREKAVSLGFPEERILLFPWGVDLAHFCPGSGTELRERTGWGQAFVLLSLRSWEPLYGVDMLVRAFARASHELADLRLLLLGGGSQAALLRQIVLQNNLMERVHFGGHVHQQNLPLYYQAADLYLSASHSDGSSVSLLEALACGKPVLVSDIPGNLEWVKDGEQGWLFSDGNEDQLVEGIFKAYHQRESLPEMGVKARRLAEQRANWAENFKVLLAAYQQARELAR